MANPEQLAKLEEGVYAWNAWRLNNRTRPDLSGAELGGIDLSGGVCLIGANLSGAIICESDLSEADLRKADLSGADLHWANFFNANLSEANLRGANLNGAYLYEAKLVDAKLRGADVSEANLGCADLRGADLREVDFSGSTLMESRLQGANITGAKIYGISVWNVERDECTKQNDLIITRHDEATVTVDDLEVAQFVYLLLKNRKIRQVIETITSKAVLILGRFTPERKSVLDAIHERLREDYGLVPILFDWEPSENRDLTETVVTLAGMCRFIIADLTDAKSILQELSHVIPLFQSVPIRPIILASQHESVIYEHLKKFRNVLSVFDYIDTSHLLDNLRVEVVVPIEEWENETNKEAAKRREATERERRLKDSLSEKEREIAELKARLKAS